MNNIEVRLIGSHASLPQCARSHIPVPQPVLAARNYHLLSPIYLPTPRHIYIYVSM